MSRYIRVRATRPQGCHRAGMFHGVAPVVYDTNELTPDQVRLLRGENGRLLLVDDVDGPEAATIVPDGDKVGQGDTFVSHPQAEQRAQQAESARADAEAMRDAALREKAAAEAQVAELQKQLADVQGERDAANEALKAAKAVETAQPEPQPEPEPADRSQAILDAVRQVVASGEGLTAAGVPKVDALEALLGFDVTAAERDAAYQAYSEA